MENIIPIRFFVITFFWSWLFWFTSIVIGKREGLSKFNFPLRLIGSFGPVVGAILSLYTLNGKDAVNSFLMSFLSLNFGFKVWVSIFFVAGIICVIAWFLPELFGEKRLPINFKKIYLFLPYLLLMTFLGGGQEEIGWRGYILPFMENNYGLIIGSLILGIIWAVWHIPLWFIPRANQKYMNFFAFTLQCIGLSFFFSWVVAASGYRLLSGLIVHGAVNTFLEIFPILAIDNNTKQKRFWTYCILYLLQG